MILRQGSEGLRHLNCRCRRPGSLLSAWLSHPPLPPTVYLLELLSCFHNRLDPSISGQLPKHVDLQLGDGSVVHRHRHSVVLGDLGTIAEEMVDLSLDRLGGSAEVRHVSDELIEGELLAVDRLRVLWDNKLEHVGGGVLRGTDEHAVEASLESLLASSVSHC